MSSHLALRIIHFRNFSATAWSSSLRCVMSMCRSVTALAIFTTISLKGSFVSISVTGQTFKSSLIILDISSACCAFNSARVASNSSLCCFIICDSESRTQRDTSSGDFLPSTDPLSILKDSAVCFSIDRTVAFSVNASCFKRSHSSSRPLCSLFILR